MIRDKIIDDRKKEPKSRAGGGVRRSMAGTAPVSRDYIRLLVDKIDTISYGCSIRGGISPLEQRQRNKTLISLLYLSARRISEIVGRKYKGFTYEGVEVSDFRKDTLEDKKVMIMNCRILKKWKKKTGKPRIVNGEVIMDMEDLPFIDYILAWLEHQQRKERRSICQSLGVVHIKFFNNLILEL